MEKRYEIFISSTSKDLKNERNLVKEAIINKNCMPICMENFPAYDIKQFEYIKSLIKKSDYYVVILAGKYGSLTEEGIGYTEKEFDYAKEIGVPILAFIRKDIDNLPENKKEKTPELRYKLDLFHKKVKENRVIVEWETPENLQYLVSDSLENAFKTQERPGWIKYNSKINQIKEKAPVNAFIKDSQKEIYITGNALGAIYDSHTLFKTLMETGVTIKLILLSETNFKKIVSN